MIFFLFAKSPSISYVNLLLLICVVQSTTWVPIPVLKRTLKITIDLIYDSILLREHLYSTYDDSQMLIIYRVHILIFNVKQNIKKRRNWGIFFRTYLPFTSIIFPEQVPIHTYFWAWNFSKSSKYSRCTKFFELSISSEFSLTGLQRFSVKSVCVKYVKF